MKVTITTEKSVKRQPDSAGQKRRTQSGRYLKVRIPMFIRCVLRHKVEITVCTLIGILLGFLYSRFMVTPLYQAMVSAYVTNISPDSMFVEVDEESLKTSQQLVESYAVVLKSDAVLKRVIKAADIRYTPAQLRGMISAGQMAGTEVFGIQVRHKNAQMAAYIANMIAEEALPLIEKSIEGSTVRVIDYASVPTSPYVPNYGQNMLLGALIGFAAAFAGFMLRWILDQKLYTEQDLRHYFNAPVLGVLPKRPPNT